jgi:hypothetical protein
LSDSRNCEACGHKLSALNKDQLCFACQRSDGLREETGPTPPKTRYPRGKQPIQEGLCAGCYFPRHVGPCARATDREAKECGNYHLIPIEEAGGAEAGGQMSTVTRGIWDALMTAGGMAVEMRGVADAARETEILRAMGAAIHRVVGTRCRGGILYCWFEPL